MELVHAPAPPRAASASPGPSEARPAAPPRPVVLRDLIATTNAGASFTPESDHAIWADACRRLAAERRPAPLRAAPTTGPRTVLLVTDSAAQRALLQQALVAAGYRVVLAGDATQALSAAAQHKPDLILTDIDSPAIDGIALIADLRRLPAHRTTGVVMLAAGTAEKQKVAGRQAGASGWIAKPSTPERFLAIVRQICPPA